MRATGQQTEHECEGCGERRAGAPLVDGAAVGAGRRAEGVSSVVAASNVPPRLESAAVRRPPAQLATRGAVATSLSDDTGRVATPAGIAGAANAEPGQEQALRRLVAQLETAASAGTQRERDQSPALRSSQTANSIRLEEGVALQQGRSSPAPAERSIFGSANGQPIANADVTRRGAMRLDEGAMPGVDSRRASDGRRRGIPLRIKLGDGRACGCSHGAETSCDGTSAPEMSLPPTQPVAPKFVGRTSQATARATTTGSRGPLSIASIPMRADGTVDTEALNRAWRGW